MSPPRSEFVRWSALAAVLVLFAGPALARVRVIPPAALSQHGVSSVCPGSPGCPPAPAPACDDGNICTDDAADGAGGCVHVPRSGGTIVCGTGACQRAVEACTGGIENTCVPGQPLEEACNHVDDDCNGLVDEIGCGSPEPRTLGYYRDLCGDDTHRSDDTIRPADAECVSGARTFSRIGSAEDVCQVLSGEGDGPAGRAEAQFMTLLLNRCRSRLWDGLTIRAGCTGLPTVGAAISEADSLLSAAARSKTDLRRAECEAQELNAGKALR